MIASDWRDRYKHKIVSIEDALKLVQSGDVIGTPMINGIAYTVLDKLYDRLDELEDVEVNLAITVKAMRLFLPQAQKTFRLRSPFLGVIEREFMKRGTHIHFAPMHLSQIPEDRIVAHPSDVVVMISAPPDENGMLSFGPWPMDREVLQARNCILQINENIPYVKGEGMQAHIDEMDCIIDLTEDIYTPAPEPPSEFETRIAEHIMPLIPDGACVQLGIGGLANAVGNFLKDKHDLGIHSEMFVESMVDLLESGAANNSKKNLDTGKTIFAFGLGSKRCMEYLDHNEAIETRSFKYVNNPSIIGQQDNFISINGTMAVDLTGQCFSESIGFNQYSGTGGQVDFVRGAQISQGGKSFICTPSVLRKKDGSVKSKICLLPEVGSYVTTVRSDVHYVVTEYGIANLRFETLENRAKGLIRIAHPDFRDELTHQAKEHGFIF
jgi:acyl-CoA hydrolase